MKKEKNDNGKTKRENQEGEIQKGERKGGSPKDALKRES